MENALLYTFSTIAQALAGAGSLLVAFALYRMQSFEAASQKATFLLRQRHLNDEELARCEAREQYQQFLARYQALEATIDASVIGPDNIAQYHRLIAASTGSGLLRHALSRALVVTGVVVSCSVGLLMFTPWLKDERLLAVFLLALGVLSFIYCLIQFLKLGTQVVAGAEQA